MSIYTEQGEAARRLLDDPNLRIVTTDPSGIFTELDVIFLAAREAGGYSPEQMKIAQRQASEAMGALFRSRQVVRYGPVKVPVYDHLDYMRVETKIAYASPEGPVTITTPNGTFPRLFVDDDSIGSQGRKLGGARDDLKPWDEQDILAPAAAPRTTTADQREILRLRAENAALQQRLEQSETELHRLREHSVPLSELEGLLTSKPRSKTRRKRAA